MAPFQYGEEDPEILPVFWEAQAEAAKTIPDTGMTVIHDIGNITDIHPRNKKEVGRRMALQALAKTYGRKDTVWSGPVFQSLEPKGAELRVKESDRLSSVSAMLTALGGTVEELPDALVITGGALAGGTVDSCRDHRIAMSAAIAAIRCANEVKILGADAVNKSYPAFYTDYNQLGGHADVV